MILVAKNNPSDDLATTGITYFIIPYNCIKIKDDFMHLADGVSTGDGHWLIDHLLTHNTVKRLLDTTEQTSLRGGRGAVIIYCVNTVY